MSDETLRTILIQSGALSEVTVPAYFSARVFQIYLGALFLTSSLSYFKIDGWLRDLFRPVLRSLESEGVGSYVTNIARLAALGIPA